MLSLKHSAQCRGRAETDIVEIRCERRLLSGRYGGDCEEGCEEDYEEDCKVESVSSRREPVTARTPVKDRATGQLQLGDSFTDPASWNALVLSATCAGGFGSRRDIVAVSHW